MSYSRRRFLKMMAASAALQWGFGQQRLPEFEIDEARYLLSFGADFLGTWLSPVRYGHKDLQFRRGRLSPGVLVQVESRFSTTAAGADLWVPIRPGTEGLLALSLLQVAADEGLGDAAALQALVGGGVSVLEPFRPEQVAEATGVAAGRIRHLARDFTGTRPSIALGGGPAAAHT